MHSTALHLPREKPVSTRRAPAVPAAVKERAILSLANWVRVAQARFNRPLFVPSISFDLVGTTAGKAFGDRMHVQLNAVLLTENLEEFERQIIPHELAHLLDKNLHGVMDGHGEKWKAIMRKLGLEPDRTHRLDTRNSRTTPYVTGYRCNCGPFIISPQGHRSIQQGGWLKCKRCKTKLRLTEPPQLHTPGRGVTLPLPPVAPRTPTPVSTPVPGRVPQRTTPTGRPPSEAMLRFAASLATKHRLALGVDVQTDFKACQSFLDTWSKAVVAPRPVSPSAPPVVPPAPRTPAPAVTGFDAPTERQLAYAQSIAARRKIDLPISAQTSKREISAWIDLNK